MMAVTCKGTVVSSFLSCAEHPTCMTGAGHLGVTGPRAGRRSGASHARRRRDPHGASPHAVTLTAHDRGAAPPALLPPPPRGGPTPPRPHPPAPDPARGVADAAPARGSSRRPPDRPLHALSGPDPGRARLPDPGGLRRGRRRRGLRPGPAAGVAAPARTRLVRLR